MENKLSHKFSIISLLRFTAPTIIMLVFMSLYQMVDGVFISNFVGEKALSGLNIVFPIISVVIAIAIMLATGGSAIIAKNMGENKNLEAKQNFTLIVCAGAVIGIILSILGLIFIDPIIRSLGATQAIYQYCYDYLFVLTLFAPLAIFQMLFQTFLVTAGKPHTGLWLTVIGGVANIVLDYVFIVEFKWGVMGAGVATAIGYSIPAVFGLIYFACSKTSTLQFVKPKFRFDVLLQACLNGSSEMVTNLAVAVTTFLFNIIMLRYLGENGVAAVTIILYSQFLLTSVFMGFASGVAPIFSYNYGEENETQIKKLFKISIGFTVVTSVIVFALAIVFGDLMIKIFASKDSEVFEITKRGFTLFSISYLFTGVNIFASSMFTAFSDGKVSAIISFLRTFVFLIICLFLLPISIGVDGIWLAVPIAEILALLVSIIYFVKLKDVYHYC